MRHQPFRGLISHPTHPHGAQYGPEPELPEEEEEEEAVAPPPPSEPEPTAAGVAETYEQAMARMFKERLVAFYSRYDESKLPQVRLHTRPPQATHTAASHN